MTFAQGLIYSVHICVNAGIVVVVVRDVFKDEGAEGTIVVSPVLSCLGVKQRVRLSESSRQVVTKTALVDNQAKFLIPFCLVGFELV